MSIGSTLPTDNKALLVLVTGSRDWTDRDTIYNNLNFLWELNGVLTVMHGDCPTGADAIARRWCERMNYRSVETIGGLAVQERRFPAEWDRHGKQAGFIRNAVMVDEKPDICLAYIKNNSKGASHTADLAESKGIRVVRYREMTGVYA